MKRLFCCALLILCAGGFAAERDGSAQRNPRPNIVFFIADDMYPEMFNCIQDGQGQYLTPNLDRLAAEGTIMFNQQVVSPVCTPSRYNCLTGQYASRATNRAFLERTEKEQGQTVIQWNTFITAGQKFLPHYLKELGYVTGFAGKNHVIEVNDLYRFPDFDSDPRDPVIAAHVADNYAKSRTAILDAGFDYAESVYVDNPDFIGLRDLAVQNQEWITQGGVKFIERNRDRPFFLYFATTIPHAPGEPERSWQADPLVTAAGFLDQAPHVQPARDTLPERVRAAGLEGDDKELVLWLDDALGALLAKLEEYGIFDHTIIFFFNDHGQKAKGTLYQGGTVSPSIVWRQGGFACGPTSGVLVQNIDFAPTILELAGATDMPDSFDGRSFKPVLDGEQAAVRKSAYFELGYARAVVKGRYKYLAVRYPPYARHMTPQRRAEVLENYNDGRRYRHMRIVNEDPDMPFSHLSAVPGGGDAEHASYGQQPHYFDSDQLYDLENDPNEMKNLANDPAYADTLRELQAELNAYLHDLPGEFPLSPEARADG